MIGALVLFVFVLTRIRALGLVGFDVVNIDRLLGSGRGTVSHDRPLLVSIGDRAICGRDRFHHRSVAIIARSAAARVTKQMSHAGVGWNGEIFLCCHCRGSDCPYWDILVRSNSPLDDDAISGMVS
jgi:hypothetical protein